MTTVDTIRNYLERYPVRGVTLRAGDGLTLIRGVFGHREQLHIAAEESLADAYAKLQAWLDDGERAETGRGG